MVDDGTRWWEQSNCAGLGWEEMGYRNDMDRKNPGADHKAIKQAKRVCSACPVKKSCLIDALLTEQNHHKSRYGIWGGMLPYERQKFVTENGGIHRAIAAIEKM